MLKRALYKMDPYKRILKSNSIVPSLAYGQILDSPWLKQMRMLSLEIEEKKYREESLKQTSKSIEDNPYFSKYADRIKEKQVQDKLKSSNESVKESTKESTKESKNKSSKETPEMESKPKKDSQESASSNAEQEKKAKMVKPKTKKFLNDIVKMELLKDKTTDEIIQIWASYHSNRDCIYGTIPKNVYQDFFANLKQYPMFILPLPRNNAQTNDEVKDSLGQSTNKECYEFFFLQIQEHAIYFTPLSAVQLHKDMAPVSFSMYHYPELVDSKGIVLMMGEYDTNLLSAIEAQCLANQLQYYYNSKDPTIQLSLHLFNKEPKSFDYMRLIRHLEEGLLTQAIGSVDLKKQD